MSAAWSINAGGQAVGETFLEGSDRIHAFRTTPTGKITDPGADLGTLGGADSHAFGINSSGQTVGSSYTTGNATIHAFRTTATGLISDPGTDLGILPGGATSTALSINKSGQTVGYADTDATGDQNYHAFFVDVNGPMLDLNNLIPAGSGWILREAHGINDSGQIAGVGMFDQTSHAFLLTPTPAPEPGMLGLLACSAAFVLTRRRRHGQDASAVRRC